MQLPELEQQVSESLVDAELEDLRLDFRSIVLRHHAATGDLNRCMGVVLCFVRSHLVTITPVTDVNDESKLHVYWLSATLPPSKPSCVAFRCGPAISKTQPTTPFPAKRRARFEMFW